MDGEGLDVVRCGAAAFSTTWQPYPTYPAQRAAEHYLASLHIPRTPAATAALRKLCAPQRNGRLAVPYEVETVATGLRRRGIVVRDGREVVIVTTVGQNQIGILQITLAELQKEWQNVHSYSGAQFAEVWLRKHFAKELEITPQAYGYLQEANPQAAEIYEEIEIMASVQTEAKPKRQVGAPAAKAIPAAKGAKGGKAAKAVAAAPAKQKTAPAEKVAKEPKAASTRASYAGKKISVLVKPTDSGLREGSNRYEILVAATKSKTTDDLLAKTVGEGVAITGSNIKGMLERGHIELID
jgi:hypothetical protein